MRREQLWAGALAVGAAAAVSLLTSCSSSVQLSSATAATVADTSTTESATSLDTTTTAVTTTAVPTTAVPTTAVPTTALPTTVAAPASTAATAPPAAPDNTAASAEPPPTTASGPCPIVHHNPATTAGCGDATPLVLEVQRELSCVGDPVVQDGVFGASTYRAVLAYQTSVGLAADGLAGPHTREQIHEACLAGDY